CIDGSVGESYHGVGGEFLWPAKAPMNKNLPVPRELSRYGFESVPAVIADAGESATRRFIEFFTANIRNKNTRLAYAQAIGRFLTWCEDRRISLEFIEPVVVAAY